MFNDLKRFTLYSSHSVKVCIKLYDKNNICEIRVSFLVMVTKSLSNSSKGGNNKKKYQLSNCSEFLGLY